MNIPKWIEDKAESYLKENIDIEYNEGVCSTTDVGDGYIAGAMEVYQELEKWKNVAGDMYKSISMLQIIGDNSIADGIRNAIEQYEKLRDNANN